jgi:uncharacterized PurR-regulated membrane protein YhhQ (DUF165 family)
MNMNKKLIGALIAFLLCIVGANWALEQYGVVNIGLGMTAPAGVFFAGLSFGLRDAVHEWGGVKVVIPAIISGAVISWWLSDAVSIPGGVTSIAVASGAAFLLAELLDLFVYTPLRERNWPSAVVASNVVGSVADSIVFLWLAFGSLEYISGQIAGKSVMVIVALPLVAYARKKYANSEMVEFTVMVPGDS